MLGVALFFIGAVLIVHGVGLTGRIEGRDSAPFNLLVGLLALFTIGLNILRADGDAGYFSAAGGLLFVLSFFFFFFL